ncbi:tyrosine-type recombinase/integrase [Mammaliicoccus sciuri]|uniref:tyrosine-type recombinase/integrase n=1 Tax=Mammaliicoccus sciuri TaxID=1296 RepID=UPI003CF98790
MATARKRGKVWQAEISLKNSDGKFIKKRKSGFRTKTEAMQYAQQQEKLVKQGYFQNKNYLIADYFKEWMNLYKKPIVSRRTYTKYETSYNSIKEYFNDKWLTEMTKKKYQSIINEYAKTHARPTVSKFNNHIRQAIKNAVEEKIILFDFTQNIVISGTQNIKKPEDKFLSYDDTQKVISYFKERLDPKIPSYYMIILAFTTGLRYSELLGLTWEDIDFQNNILHVRRSYDYHNHTGMKKTKSYSSVRKVPLNDDISNILYIYKKEQLTLFEKFSIDNPLNQIFYHYVYGIISNNAVNKSLKRAIKSLNITPSITMHGARHTFGSILLYKGIDIITISILLGHKDTNITQEVYLHQIKEMEKKNHSIINSIINDLLKNPNSY